MAREEKYPLWLRSELSGTGSCESSSLHMPCAAGTEVRDAIKPEGVRRYRKRLQSRRKQNHGGFVVLVLTHTDPAVGRTWDKTPCGEHWELSAGTQRVRHLIGFV